MTYKFKLGVADVCDGSTASLSPCADHFGRDKQTCRTFVRWRSSIFDFCNSICQQPTVEMKEAANRGGLPLRRGRLNVRCAGRRVRQRARFVHPQFNIGCFFKESCGDLGVCCCFSQPKQDRRLTHEVLFSNHLIFPVVSQR